MNTMENRAHSARPAQPLIQLIKILRTYPDLTIEGVGGDRYGAARANLLGRYDQFGEVLAWLATPSARKSIRRNGGYSYGIKHDAEKAIGGHLPNGVLIAAALAASHRIRRIAGSVNCRICQRAATPRM
ncbi:MAG: hypothetical protein M9932_11610 [Xanthobacteraceae bacterium]|nr:hypothetical protein [Xanthobacteraceae bacterium]